MGIFEDFLESLGFNEKALPRVKPPKTLTLPASASGLSTTVFDGDAAAWSAHLDILWTLRPDRRFAWNVQFGDRGTVRLFARNADSEPWAAELNWAFEYVAECLERKPQLHKIYREMLEPSRLPLSVFSSACLPSPSSRETLLDGQSHPVATRVLLNSTLLDDVAAQLCPSERKPVRLGRCWPVFQTLLRQVARHTVPRDRFIERIEETTLWALINLHVLYEERKQGKLVCNAVGEEFEQWEARRTGLSRNELYTRHPFFRLLNDLSFLLSEKAIDSLLPTAQVIVRDFLDSGYLRLSLASIMPTVLESSMHMPFEWREGGKGIRTPKPEIGQFGIVDSDDFDAWKNVAPAFADIGLGIIGQLGMGQFGRVYEAVNLHGAKFPERVAVKVDRFRKGHKKEAIESAETILGIGRDLAASPHVIRVFDAGKLQKQRATYHILQLVEGDTLDHLLGIAGTEHASMLRPQEMRRSHARVTEEIFKLIEKTKDESWRATRRALRFTRAPSLNQMLDILVSTALWVEEVHDAGYAVNDLKNGNVMINRGGQFKAIDLDSYSPVFNALDKMTDFFFLGIATLQMLATAATWTKPGGVPPPRVALMEDSVAFTEYLRKAWNFGEIEAVSDGRVSSAEMFSTLAAFVNGCRAGGFAEAPASFTAAIDGIIDLKRRLSGKEIVVE